MHLTINLLPTKKSKVRMGFGILTILFGVFWIFFSLDEKESFTLFHWSYSIVLVLIGIAHLFEGAGGSFFGLFGAKAFIQMNDDEIYIKPEAFKMGKAIRWSEIKTLEYKAAQYKITKTDSSIVFLEIPTDSYRQVQSIKEIIESFAFEKGIQVT